MAVGHQPGQSRATRPRIVIESPFAANFDYTVEQNVQLARNACRSCVMGGGNPIASHLLYTQFLDDQNINERAAGIECGLDWSRFADEAWFVLRHGGILSRGMKVALLRHISLGKTLRFFITYNEGRTLVETLAFEEILDDHETKDFFLPTGQLKKLAAQEEPEETVQESAIEEVPTIVTGVPESERPAADGDFLASYPRTEPTEGTAEGV